MKQIWILFMARRSKDILFGGNLLSDEVSFDIGSDCSEPRFGSPDYAMNSSLAFGPSSLPEKSRRKSGQCLSANFRKSDSLSPGRRLNTRFAPLTRIFTGLP